MSSRQNRRPYRLSARADGQRRTRERIVAAAVALHGERGIRATGWEQVAARAGVSTATVYRHFADLDALVPACAASAFEAGSRLPGESEMAALFAGLATPAERLDKLIRESCRCYALGEDWLAACHREAHAVPAAAAAVAGQEAALQRLVRAAVRGVPGADRRALRALLDFPFWKALVDSGEPRDRIPAVIVRLARSLLAG